MADDGEDPDTRWKQQPGTATKNKTQRGGIERRTTSKKGETLRDYYSRNVGALGHGYLCICIQMERDMDGRSGHRPLPGVVARRGVPGGFRGVGGGTPPVSLRSPAEESAAR